MPYTYDRTAATTRVSKMELDPKDLASIAAKTDRNDATGALLEAAKVLGLRNLAKKFELIAQLLKLEGYMPAYLGKYRYSLMEALLDEAKKVLSPEDHEALHRSL